MKRLLAVAAGLTSSLGMFAGGAVLATYTLTAQPVAVQVGSTQDVTKLWTAEPRSIDREEQNLERIAAATVPPEPERSVEQTGNAEEITMASADPTGWPRAGIDELTTGSIGSSAAIPAAEPDASRLSTAHVQWCADRYRSYRVETNSYTPYSGGQRPCVSPYADQGGSPDEAAFLQPKMVVSSAVTSSTTGRHVEAASRHVQSCFDRYRSYRPEDNTYQPFGGGPRKQCQ